MKKNSKLISIIAALLSLTMLLPLASCKPDNKDALEGADYVYNSGGFTLFVPENWTVSLASSSVSAKHEDGTTVTVSPFSYKNTDGMNLKKGWEQIKSNLETFFNSEYTVSSNNFTDDALGVDDSVTLGGMPAGSVYYYGKIKSHEGGYIGDISGEYMYKYMFRSVFTIYDFSFYHMTISSPTENYKSHEEEIENIIKYFEFGSSEKTHEGYKAAVAPEKTVVETKLFKLIVDRDWITDNSTGVITARYANGFPSSVNVMTAKLGDNKNAVDYWFSYLDEFKRSLKNFTLIPSECSFQSGVDTDSLPITSIPDKIPLKVAGYETSYFVYTAVPSVDVDGNDTLYKYCQALVTVGDELIIITYASSADTEDASGYYKTHYETFIDILENFEISSETQKAE